MCKLFVFPWCWSSYTSFGTIGLCWESQGIRDWKANSFESGHVLCASIAAIRLIQSIPCSLKLCKSSAWICPNTPVRSIFCKDLTKTWLKFLQTCIEPYHSAGIFRWFLILSFQSFAACRGHCDFHHHVFPLQSLCRQHASKTMWEPGANASFQKLKKKCS